MGRRVRRFLVIPAAAIVLLTLLLATCNNDFDIFEAIKTDVKIANDLFLKITDSSPAKNAQDISQLERIEIEFDRSININTVDQSSIVFDPAPDPLSTTGMQDWSFIYNDTTKTLFIYPDPVLNAVTAPDTVQYTVTVNRNLKGTDGSDLQEPYSWSFETKESATGNFFIESTNDSEGRIEGTVDLYTNDATVDLWVYGMNSITARFLVGETEDEIVISNPSLWPVKTGVGTTEQWYMDSPSGPASITLSGADGEKTLYMGFSDGVETPAARQLKADTIILDRQGPSVTITTSTITTNTSRIYSNVSDTWSGINGYGWTTPAAVTLVSSTVEDPYISSVTANVDDVKYTFTLEATDGAENITSVSKSIKIDTRPPDPPAVFGEVDGSKYGPVDFDGAFYWYWKSGGSKDASNVYQFYRPDIDDWVKETKETMYKVEVRNYGPYTLKVGEFDDDYNLSDLSSLTMYFSPSYKVLYPVWGQEIGIGLNTDLNWPDYKGDVKEPVYDVYIRVDGASTFDLLHKTAVDLKASEWMNGGAVTLKSGIRYEWFVAVKEGVGGKEVDYLPAHPKTGPYYSFTVD